MKTQISRDSFHTDKRYSGVYQQQGRMLVDADWNELVDIVKHRLDDALKDVVNNGAPLHNGIIDFSTDPPQIRWGSVYAAGIKAELLPRIEAGSPVPATFDFTQQQDFPGVDTIAPSGDYQLYADIWERPVISIEDETLRDPGLHGADTCTRTRTMVQVKWCADTIDPETDIAQNPKKGDALLDLSLRETGTGDGDGDPCGNEITTIDQKTGNHLFRLEAHDVTGDPGNPDAIVLKWSSENGAEQHVVREDGTLTDTVPTEFTTGDWIYEQYNDTSETHVGVHLASASGFPARFDLITDGFPASIASDAQYIRRWDGCCTLTQNGTWSVQGKDGAVELTEISASTPDENATHGDVKFESGQVKIFLNNMVLTLDLTGKTFVAGDFWLAMVRDNTEEDDRIQMVSKGPVGINHHYINIAQFQSDAIVLPDNKETRKFSFPALSNLTADKVGYDPATTQARWTDIHDNPAIPMPLTVQRAIDDLVENLESSDISYLIPSCSAPLSIREMLPSIQGLADDGEQKINEILDALLCELRAATLPCEDRGADISVQDALDNRVHNDGDTMTGKLTIQSDLEVTRNVGIGTASPAAQLHVSGGADTSLTTHGLMVLGNINGDNISFDANEIMARDNGASAPLYFNHNGGQVIVNGSGPGNMSIGTAADSGDRLNINGSLRATGFRMTTSPQDNYVLTSDATGVGTWQPSAAASWRLTGSGNLVTDSSLVTGNVGIGTASPDAILHLVKPNVSSRHILKMGNQNQGSREWSIDVDGSANMQINNEGAGSPLTAMRFNNNGNVGIGTETPGRILDVDGQITLRTGSLVNAGIWLKNSSEADEWFMGKRNYASLNQIGFWNAAWRMVIQDDGNVGIGTTAPGKDRLDVRGRCYSSGGWQTTNADYAEYFETSDGKAIPVATPVTLTSDGKVKKAEKDEVPMGITSENSALVGNSYKEWPEKYLHDEFGSPIMENVKIEKKVAEKKKLVKERQKIKVDVVTEEKVTREIVQENGKYIQKELIKKIKREVEAPIFDEVDLYDSTGKTIIGKHRVPVMESYEEEVDVLDEDGLPVLVGTGEFDVVEQPKLNPKYDASKEYIPRNERPEWCCVGLLGQLPLRKGNPVAPTWIKIKDLSDKVELWLVK